MFELGMVGMCGGAVFASFVAVRTGRGLRLWLGGAFLFCVVVISASGMGA